MVYAYKYGLMEPIQTSNEVSDQLHHAHVYQNKLVELERQRRQAVDALVVTPELVQAYTEAKEAKGKGLSKTKTDKLWTAYRKLRDANRNEHAADIERITENFANNVKAARKETQAYWGTYLQVEKASEASAKDSLKESGREAPDKPVYPRFKRWKHEGNVTVQIQKGMSVAELVSAEDRRLKLDLNLSPVPNRNGKPLPRLYLRIGSTGPHKDPVWATWPIIYHRPLPEGAVIKQVSVTCRKLASKTRWSAVFYLECADLAPVTNVTNCVALDIGWRRTEKDPQSVTRAGEWWDGKTGEELVLETEVMGGLIKVDDLKSIRAKHRLVISEALTSWISKVGRQNTPEEFAERTRYCSQWLSESKFARLCIWWRKNRFTGDSEMYERLDKWRVKDKHLWEWEANQRQASLGRRLHFYRCVAAKLAKTHDGLIIEKLNLSDLIQSNKSDDAGQHQSRAQKQYTAPSLLRNAVENAFTRCGKPIYEVQASCGAKAIYQHWIEGKATLKGSAPARSERYNRLRKIVDPSENKTEEQNQALAQA